MPARFNRSPKRFLEQAPVRVRTKLLDLYKLPHPLPLEYEFILTPLAGGCTDQIVGMDVGASGVWGQHFFLKPHEARSYRDRNRRNRVLWQDLPQPVQDSICAYLRPRHEENSAT